MFSNLVSLISKSLYQAPVQTVAQVQEKTNSFTGSSRNIFLNNGNTSTFYSYAKNQPIEGGYFAGYYNNKPNIVGRKLFIEI